MNPQQPENSMSCRPPELADRIDLSRFDRCRVLVVGDLMVDEYLWGVVERISPEAPVQVVSVENENYTLGGAGNVVNNLVALGAGVTVVGVTGDDDHGRLLLDRFNDLGVNTTGVFQEPGRPTTRKTRVIAAGQHVVRIDRETRKPVSGPVLDRLTRFIETEATEADVVLVSDYGKGLVTEPLMAGIVEAARRRRRAVLADPKGLDFLKYAGVTILTPNRKEAALAAGIDIADEATLFEAANRLLKKLDIEKFLITCGSDGMVLFDRGKYPHKIKADPRQVYDVSGAGDTVLAVLGLATATGAAFEDAAALANCAAGIVIGKVGTATVSKAELISATNPRVDANLRKRKNISEIRELIEELKRKNRRIVFTNGCFDLLHAGHIRFFSDSKQLGDVLIVAIDDDDSVKRVKGPERPVIGQSQRARILRAIDCVDYVIVFSSDQLKPLMEIIRPDILTKGSNYAAGQVFGSEVVEKYGGKVVLVPVTEDISSSRIISSIKNGDRAK